MAQNEQYTIWLQPLGSVTELEESIKLLSELQEVISTSTTNIEAPGITKKEAVLAVALSVTANFATDGLKAVLSHIQEDETAKVVLCRRPDGSNFPIGQDVPGS